MESKILCGLNNVVEQDASMALAAVLLANKEVGDHADPAVRFEIEGEGEGAVANPLALVPRDKHAAQAVIPQEFTDGPLDSAIPQQVVVSEVTPNKSRNDLEIIPGRSVNAEINWRIHLSYYEDRVGAPKRPD
jgi:hypothetical protein